MVITEGFGNFNIQAFLIEGFFIAEGYEKCHQR